MIVTLPITNALLMGMMELKFVALAVSRILRRSGEILLSCPILSAMSPNSRIDGSTQPARRMLTITIPKARTVSAPRFVFVNFPDRIMLQHLSSIPPSTATAISP